MQNTKIEAPHRRKSDITLSIEQIGLMLEMWVAGVSIINCAKRFNTTHVTICRHINRHYMYKSGENTVVVSLPSKANSLP